MSKPPEERQVVVLGASPKPGRYSNQAVRLLLERGFRVTPIHPKAESIEGLAVLERLERVVPPVDTLTLYLGPERLRPQIDAILALAPQRVIFNPGSECRDLEQRLDQAGIPWEQACTLVLLTTKSF
jgi:predicted CoA-binding protein